MLEKKKKGAYNGNPSWAVLQIQKNLTCKQAGRVSHEIVQKKRRKRRREIDMMHECTNTRETPTSQDDPNHVLWYSWNIDLIFCISIRLNQIIFIIKKWTSIICQWNWDFSTSKVHGLLIRVIWSSIYLRLDFCKSCLDLLWLFQGLTFVFYKTSHRRHFYRFHIEIQTKLLEN